MPAWRRRASHRRAKAPCAVLVAEDNRGQPARDRDDARQARLRASTSPRDGREALEKLAGGAYAAVFMDCQMPVVDGYAATGRLRASEPAGQAPAR